MGNNTSVSAKAALAVQNVKSQANSMINKPDKNKKRRIIENPETRSEMTMRRQMREKEFKKSKEDRQKRIANLQTRWEENQGTDQNPGKNNWTWKNEEVQEDK